MQNSIIVRRNKESRSINVQDSKATNSPPVNIANLLCTCSRKCCTSTVALIPKMSMKSKVEDIICARIANHSDSATLAIRRDNVSLSSGCSSPLSPVSGEYNILLSDSILFQRMLLLYGYYLCVSRAGSLFLCESCYPSYPSCRVEISVMRGGKSIDPWLRIPPQRREYLQQYKMLGC